MVASTGGGVARLLAGCIRLSAGSRRAWTVSPLQVHGSQTQGWTTLSAAMYSSRECDPKERTFLMIKPDGVQRGCIGQIIQRFERRGYKLVALKMMTPTDSLLKEHYQNIADKPFFADICKYMSSGPVVPMVWEGKNVVLTARDMLGATDPLKSTPGTIRADFGIDIGRNVIHGSDSVTTAEREIALWFSIDELNPHQLSTEPWIYE